MSDNRESDNRESDNRGHDIRLPYKLKNLVLIVRGRGVSTVFVLVSIMLGLFSGTANAAQQALTASRGTLLDDIETTLAESQVTILDQAQTDRFAIIYATHDPSGAHLTITLTQNPLEETRISLTVASDSPGNETFDQTLLQTLIDTQR